MSNLTDVLYSCYKKMNNLVLIHVQYEQWITFVHIMYCNPFFFAVFKCHDVIIAFIMTLFLGLLHCIACFHFCLTTNWFSENTCIVRSEFLCVFQ